MGSASDKDIYELTELEIPDVSYVAAGANRKTWTVIKSAEEALENQEELAKSPGCDKVKASCMSMKEKAGESGKQAEKDCAKAVSACERMSKSVDKASDDEDEDLEEDPTDAITGAWRLIAPYKDELAVGLIAAFAAALKATGKDFSYGYPAPEAELSDSTDEDEEADKSVKAEKSGVTKTLSTTQRSKLAAEIKTKSTADLTAYNRRIAMWAAKGSLLTGFSKDDMNWFHNQIAAELQHKAKANGTESTAGGPLKWGAISTQKADGSIEKCHFNAVDEIAEQNKEKTAKSSSPLTLEGGDTVMDEYIARQLDEDSPREPEDEAFTDKVLKAAAEKDVSPEALKAIKGALRLLMPVKDELDSDLIEELQEAVPQGAGVPAKSVKKTRKQTDEAPADDEDDVDDEDAPAGKKKSSKKSEDDSEDQEKRKSRSTKSKDGDDGDIGEKEMKDTNKSAFDGLPEEIYKQFEDVRKTAAEAVAKAEKLEHEKLESEYIAKAREMPNVGDPVQMGQRLMHLAELDPKLAEEMEATLKSANERIAQGDLFAVVGSPMSGNVGGPGEQLEGLANALVQKGDKKLTQEQALEEVMKTAEGAKLAAQLYEQEESARGMRSGNPKIASGWKA